MLLNNEATFGDEIYSLTRFTPSTENAKNKKSLLEKLIFAAKAIGLKQLNDAKKANDRHTFLSCKAFKDITFSWSSVVVGTGNIDWRQC